MKRSHMLLAVVLGLALVMPASAQEKGAAMSPEQQAAMDAWTKAAAPGAAHKRLAQFEGNWNVTSTMWMAPGAPPENSTGTATYRMILGGRYLREKVESQMMGMAFEGIGYTGYDNLKGVYVGSWVDNFGTGILIAEGSWDEAANALVTTAEMPDPVSGRTVKTRMVTRIVDADTHVAEFYQPGPDGQEFMGMQITYKRAQAVDKPKTKTKGK